MPRPELTAIGKCEVAMVDAGGDFDLLDSLHIVSIRSLARRNGSSRSSTST